MTDLWVLASEGSDVPTEEVGLSVWGVFSTRRRALFHLFSSVDSDAELADWEEDNPGENLYGRVIATDGAVKAWSISHQQVDEDLSDPYPLPDGLRRYG